MNKIDRDKMAKDTMTNALLVLMLVGLIWASWDVLADNNHHSFTQPPPIYTTVQDITVHQVDSQAIAFAQAGANNNISAGTFKPQLSLGIGSYESDFAASLMFGQKACKDCLLFSGSFAFDENFEETAFGFGATVTFK